MDQSRDNISGKNLADKIGQLLSEKQLKISVDKFQETCNNPSVQPFLKWFCQHVGPDNILSKKEIQLKKNLKETNVWLTGDKLDGALSNALSDHPQLLSKVDKNFNYETELSRTCDAEKEAYDEDLKYQSSLNNSFKRLKELELKQEENIEKEEAILEKLEIKNYKAYNDCVHIMEEYDSLLREANLLLQHALNVYSDAAEKRGPVICWTQVPLNIYIKQLDTYNNYLEFYIKKKYPMFGKLFSTNSSSDDEAEGYDLSIDSSKELEAKQCEAKLAKAVAKKTDVEIERSTGEATIMRVIEIYNNGEIKIPQTDAQINSEIADLKARRDILLQSNTLLEHELKDSIDTYGGMVVSEVVVGIYESRLQHKNIQLKQLQDILYITRDMGHAHSDLLAILMQLQLHKLLRLKRFVPDAQSNLNTIYGQSSKRRELLKSLQTQYSTIASSTPCNQNIYNKLFSKLVSGDKNSGDLFESSVKQYSEIIAENKSLKQQLLEDYFYNKLEKLQSLENQVMVIYNNELNSGPTRSFKFMPNKLVIQFENVLTDVENNQQDFNQIRRKFKKLLEKISQNSLERDKEILWQRFLADPQTLKQIYDQAQNELNRSHFRNTLLNE
ncbi:HAUS augmin-like complex subunit 3 [Microplitis demolitor]|uniref:HAUS augmin-like complex subunit 3 n=1 Tax=Microplitis demolitor TaxID=69319 RepID=UPI00043FFEB6|nr:HAUS augmin-like complex subunit 3 [Microplitis demolitor]